MVILAILFIVLSTVAFCRLCFSAATLALPLCVGGWAGFALFQAHSGWVLAVIAATLVALLTHMAGHFAIAFGRQPLLKLAVMLAFFAPAAFVGYTVLHGMMGALHQPNWSCVTVAIVGGAITGGTAIYRVLSLAGSPDAMRSAPA